MTVDWGVIFGSIATIAVVVGWVMTYTTAVRRDARRDAQVESMSATLTEVRTAVLDQSNRLAKMEGMVGVFNVQHAEHDRRIATLERV